MTGAGPGLEKLKMPGPGPSQDRNFFYCRGRTGIYFFYCQGRDFLLLPGPGRHRNFFLLSGPGRDLNYFINGAGIFFYCRGRAGIYIFYCRGRAEIKIFIAGAGQEKLRMPGPGRGLNFFYCRGRAGI